MEGHNTLGWTGDACNTGQGDFFSCLFFFWDRLLSFGTADSIHWNSLPVLSSHTSPLKGSGHRAGKKGGARKKSIDDAPDDLFFSRCRRVQENLYRTRQRAVRVGRVVCRLFCFQIWVFVHWKCLQVRKYSFFSSKELFLFCNGQWLLRVTGIVIYSAHSSNKTGPPPYFRQTQLRPPLPSMFQVHCKVETIDLLWSRGASWWAACQRCETVGWKGRKWSIGNRSFQNDVSIQHTQVSAWGDWGRFLLLLFGDMSGGLHYARFFVAPWIGCFTYFN